MEPGPNGSLSDREREKIKDAFASFNKDIDALIASQQELSVADIQQARMIRQGITAKVVPVYADFYHKCVLLHLLPLFATFRYAKLEFSRRNPEKYLRRTPQDLSDTIDQMFDVIAE